MIVNRLRTILVKIGGQIKGSKNREIPISEIARTLLINMRKISGGKQIINQINQVQRMFERREVREINLQIVSAKGKIKRAVIAVLFMMKSLIVLKIAAIFAWIATPMK